MQYKAWYKLEKFSFWIITDGRQQLEYEAVTFLIV